MYLREFGAISERLSVESHGGTSALALFVPGVGAAPVTAAVVFGVAALLLGAVAWRDVAAAGWLAVPIGWPAAEYHYATLTLPVVRRIAALVMAMAVPWSALVGVLILAGSLVLRPRQAEESGEAPMGLVAWLKWWLAAPAVVLRSVARRRLGSSAVGPG
jgi:hypothetical protein